MKFLNFKRDGKYVLGVKREEGILEINTPASITELISGGDESVKSVDVLLREEIQGGLLKEEELELGPSVLEPGKIICVGLNYRKHAEESGMAVPETPILFNKFNNALAAHKENVNLPQEVQQGDYEAELAIVIGKKGKNIKKEDALSHVFGYSCANDLSARDLQFKTSQWLLGKTSDGFCPIGPYLVTADEIKNPNKLGIRTYHNGVLRQDSNTSDMIFYCDEIISYISKFMTLYPGDVILTGTPEGVIMGLPEDEKDWLKAGDVIKVEIEGLGSLETQITRIEG